MFPYYKIKENNWILLKLGETINENYGPIFTQKEREERKQVLKERYWFDCRCTFLKTSLSFSVERIEDLSFSFVS